MAVEGDCYHSWTANLFIIFLSQCMNKDKWTLREAFGMDLNTVSHKERDNLKQPTHHHHHEKATFETKESNY